MKKNNDVFAELIVGIFMVAVLALLVYFTVVISGVDIMMGRAKTMARITFRDVGGLKERDNVVYRGMKVGVVEAIELSPTNVMVTVNIDSGVVLRKSCRATVAATSLLGGNYLLLEEGAGEELPLATSLFTGEPAMDWMRDLSKIASAVNEIIAEGSLKNIVSNLVEASEKVNEIITRVERGEGTVGKLLSSDDTVYKDLSEAVEGAKRAVADAENTFAGARKTFDNAAVIAERLNNGEGTLGKLLSSDDRVYEDLKKALANVSAISERIEKGEGTLGKLTSSDDALWNDLTNSVANVRIATEKLKNGDSTLGKLTTESGLYDEISGLIKDIRQIVDNYRDTTPITTFGSLATGAL